MPLDLFCDGGVIGSNPSAFGGTWGWCLILDGEMLRHGSGIITPEEARREAVTNNLTELYAAVRALEATRGKITTLHTDSKVTQHRLNGGNKFVGVPHWLVKRTRMCGIVKAVLVGGHPTKKELRDGKRERNGLPVSLWNVFCDRECTRLAKEYKR